jgi:glycosyltransferase involved in cell wall biosynthesis
MLIKQTPEIPDPPSASRTGWPWDCSGVNPDEAVTDVKTPPLISIIIPSFNQGGFIEETIRSIIFQRYKNVEIIVIDGGSSDNSLDVIKKYERWLTYWVSERDSGQANAINKGLAVARGEIIKWLNSDDLLLPGALNELAKSYAANKKCFFVSPVEHFLDGTDKRRVFEPKNVSHEKLVEFWSGEVIWNDPGTFYTREVIDTVGGIDESYRYSFDYDFVLRATEHFQASYLKKATARFRVHQRSKTISEGSKFIYETASVSRKHWGEMEEVDRRGFERYFAVTMFRSGVSSLRRPRAALSYFSQGYKTNKLLSPWWLALWALKVLRSRLRIEGKGPDRWSGFGMK